MRKKNMNNIEKNENESFNSVKQQPKNNCKQREILFVYDALRIGGCERVITVLSKAFIKKGIKVTILLIKKDIVEFELPEEICIKTFHDYSNKFLWSPVGIKLFMDMQIQSVLAKILKVFPTVCNRFNDMKETADGMWKIYHRYGSVIHQCLKDHPNSGVISFMDNPNFALLLSSCGCKNPIIISERSHPDRDDIQPYFKKNRNKLYVKADLCVFQSEGARSYFPDSITRKSVVIENPIEESIPQPYVGTRRKEIITFCRIDRQKNLVGLLHAFGMVAEKFPKYNLAIYGKGDQEEILATEIQKMDLGDRVFLRKYDSKVHEMVKDASMYVSFSNYEGISNSMIEAMAMGMPVICTDCPAGGARAMICSGENGLLVQVGDEKGMAEAMEYMITHEKEAKRMGEQAALIRQKCNPDVIAERWLSAIDSIGC